MNNPRIPAVVNTLQKHSLQCDVKTESPASLIDAPFESNLAIQPKSNLAIGVIVANSTFDRRRTTMLVRKIHFAVPVLGLLATTSIAQAQVQIIQPAPVQSQRGGDRAERAAAAAGRDDPTAPGGGADHVLAPGHWMWNGASWAWAPGQYVARPAPTAVWSPGHWEPQPDRRLPVGGRQLAGVMEVHDAPHEARHAAGAGARRPQRMREHRHRARRR